MKGGRVVPPTSTENIAHVEIDLLLLGSTDLAKAGRDLRRSVAIAIIYVIGLDRFLFVSRRSASDRYRRQPIFHIPAKYALFVEYSFVINMVRLNEIAPIVIVQQ